MMIAEDTSDQTRKTTRKTDSVQIKPTVRGTHG
jgi:hypothetical protein